MCSAQRSFARIPAFLATIPPTLATIPSTLATPSLSHVPTFSHVPRRHIPTFSHIPTLIPPPSLVPFAFPWVQQGKFSSNVGIHVRQVRWTKNCHQDTLLSQSILLLQDPHHPQRHRTPRGRPQAKTSCDKTRRRWRQIRLQHKTHEIKLSNVSVVMLSSCCWQDTPYPWHLFHGCRFFLARLPPSNLPSSASSIIF